MNGLHGNLKMRKMLKKINDGLSLFSDGHHLWLQSGNQLQGIVLSHVTKDINDFIYLRGAEAQETWEEHMPLSPDQKEKPVHIVNDNDAVIAALEGGS